MRVYGTPLDSIDILTNNKLINYVSSKAQPCVSFLDLLCAHIANVRTFAELNMISFGDPSLKQIRIGMVSANFIPEVQDEMYSR